jgi:hypothetical protein
MIRLESEKGKYMFKLLGSLALLLALVLPSASNASELLTIAGPEDCKSSNSPLEPCTRGWFFSGGGGGGIIHYGLIAMRVGI